MLYVMTTQLKVLCKGTNKAGNPCGRTPSPGREYCKLHGGRNKIGFEHPNFKSGRYSKHLPARLYSTYEEMRRDPALLSLQEENALMLVRINDLLSRTDTGEAGENWASLKKTFNKLIHATEMEDSYEVANALADLGHAINKGYSDYTAWAAVLDAIERRRKLVDTERRLTIDLGRSISADRALIWIGSIMDSVIRNVSENVNEAKAKRIIGAISEDLNRLLNFDGRVEDNDIPSQPYDVVDADMGGVGGDS
jgi:hypothetical protein